MQRADVNLGRFLELKMGALIVADNLAVPRAEGAVIDLLGKQSAHAFTLISPRDTKTSAIEKSATTCGLIDLGGGKPPPAAQD